MGEDIHDEMNGGNYHQLWIILKNSHKNFKNLAIKSEALALAPALTLFVVPSGLEPDRALRNCPVGNFSEGARLQRWPSDPEEYENIIFLS